MTTDTATITDFILARVAEDEAVAMAALREAAYTHFGDTAAESLLGLATSEGADDVAVQHFRRHDPARILAQCKATRAIVESYATFRADAGNVERSTLDRVTAGGAAAGLDVALLALAAVYVDHADHRAEWSL